MSKPRDDFKKARRLAQRLARATDKLAARRAALERAEEGRAQGIAERAAATGAPSIDPPSHPITPAHPRTNALLIINTKSGPKDDSILRVRQVVERLAAHGIETKVRVKLRKKVARKQARRAAKKGVPLVIAAGGDGTVASIAEGLIGQDTALGIIPLGTYNNIATSLGIPTSLDEAVALIASGVVRGIDVGLVTATGAKRPRIFIEMAAAGVIAAVMPVGQEVKSHEWKASPSALRAAVEMTPTDTVVRLDKTKPYRHAKTLMVAVANAPRGGPGAIVNPAARLDDGLLDVAIYHDHTQAELAVYFASHAAGKPVDDPRIERARARRVDVQTANALPVVANEKLVGRTPARFEILAGSLLVVAGNGPGLSAPPEPAVVEAGTPPAPDPPRPPDEKEDLAAAGLPTPEARGPLRTVADAIGPIASHAVETLKDAAGRVVRRDDSGNPDGDAPPDPNPARGRS